MKTTAAESTCGLIFPLLVGCSLIQLSGTLGTEVYGDEGGSVYLLCDPVYDDHETLYWEVVQGTTGFTIILVKEPGRELQVHERRYRGRLSLQGGNNLRISNLNRDDDSVDSTDPHFVGAYRCSQGTAGTQWILRVKPKTTPTVINSYRTRAAASILDNTIFTGASASTSTESHSVSSHEGNRRQGELEKVGCPLENALPSDEDRIGNSFKPRGLGNASNITLHPKEASPVFLARATKPGEDRRKPKSDFSAMSIYTHPKYISNTTEHEDNTPQSLSSDGSSFSQPHTLRSSLPHSRGFRLQSLADMISSSSGESQPSRGYEEETREGRVRSTGTFTEDIMRRPALPGYRDRHSNINVRALSLSERKVATTIDLMIKKRLVDRGNLGIPYHKFSDLCLQLYNTGSNWKLLAGKLGFSVGDVDVIDNCSAHHGLLAAEIVLRHWQRTAGQAGTSMIPCNLQNLQRILVDMERNDLFNRITKELIVIGYRIGRFGQLSIHYLSLGTERVRTNMHSKTCNFGGEGTEVFGEEGGSVDLTCDPVYDDHEILFWEVIQGTTGFTIVLVKEPGKETEIHEKRYAERLLLENGNNLRISNLNRDDDSVDSTDPHFVGTYRCSQGTAGTQWILRVRRGPAHPTNLTVTAVRLYSVEVKVTGGHDGLEPQSLCVWYREHGMGEWKKGKGENSCQDGVDEGQEITLRSTLPAANTPYQICVVAQNRLNSSRCEEPYIQQATTDSLASFNATIRLPSEPYKSPDPNHRENQELVSRIVNSINTALKPTHPDLEVEVIQFREGSVLADLKMSVGQREVRHVKDDFVSDVRLERLTDIDVDKNFILIDNKSPKDNLDLLAKVLLPIASLLVITIIAGVAAFFLRRILCDRKPDFK
ncbi:hypothetical protein Bbelb_247800, partial [Branchiostoma belcheri]